ncbi:hypothetical protein PFICI_10852 [Pestalotiopsis fici W106-1]|uniref:MOSC domain-containing protein n=1 Tax=Pestalotiopsis fici (strain W106-1 / CGMCC3.15140) TaxID=1229662 RepID=W3WSX5_PESFW|nr:uncharacterized protein PFICI_10852 [Pestalotiopsis fici W106-1]ETS76978.1 hypothetical protein PFICI_10852 [Pestalotiopsis fici W106-1]
MIQEFFNVGTSSAHVQVAVVIAILVIALVVTFSQKSGPPLEISQLYIYPVKSLRGCRLEKAYIGRYGLLGDRTFCLQRIHRDEDGNLTRHETMLIGYYLQLALFRTAIDLKDQGENMANAQIRVSWHGAGSEFGASDASVDSDQSIQFPLVPSLEGRSEVQVDLHGSSCAAYDMGDEISQWFTDRLGFEIRLVHIGNGSRPVLGTLAPHSRGGLKKARLVRRIRATVPFLAQPEERLAFNDIAHYLVVTEESNRQVSSRLDGDSTMDVTKFRPNIVVQGSPGAFVEDYWGEITFDGGIEMPLTANCYRCQSITVDYDTGKTATDDRGAVWKKLNKDRRVDKGAKYSPVFGRYGYCFESTVGKELFVGQTAQVTYINKERTHFDWPALTTFGVTQTKK